MDDFLQEKQCSFLLMRHEATQNNTNLFDPGKTLITEDALQRLSHTATILSNFHIDSIVTASDLASLETGQILGEILKIKSAPFRQLNEVRYTHLFDYDKLDKLWWQQYLLNQIPHMEKLHFSSYRLNKILNRILSFKGLTLMVTNFISINVLHHILNMEYIQFYPGHIKKYTLSNNFLQPYWSIVKEISPQSNLKPI